MLILWGVSHPQGRNAVLYSAHHLPITSLGWCVMASLSYFPLYPKDFLGSTGRLSPEDFGIYTRLLFASWVEPLKNDQKELRNLTLASSKKTTRILQRFFELKGDVWVNNRLEKERSKAVKKHKVAVAKAKKAAEARWSHSDDATSNATSNAQAYPQALPTQNSDTSTKVEVDSSTTLKLLNDSGLIITNPSVVRLLSDYHKSTNDDFLLELIATLKTKTAKQANTRNYVKAILDNPPAPDKKPEPKKIRTEDVYRRI